MSSNIAWVNPHQLTPHPERARVGTILKKTDGKYQLLRDSIAANGIEVPLKVQAGTNIILAGHTRQRIAIELDMQMVPVQYMDVDDETAEFTMVIDNHLRAGDEKDPIKMAETFRTIVQLMGYEMVGDWKRKENNGGESIIQKEKESTGWTLSEKTKQRSIKEIAEYFDMSRSNFFRYLELLNLIPDLQSMVSSGKIGIKAGSILSKLSESQQMKIYASIPKEEREKAEYRLSESEAKNLAEIFSHQETSEEGYSESAMNVANSIKVIEIEEGGEYDEKKAWAMSMLPDPDMSAGASAYGYIGQEERNKYLQKSYQLDREHSEEQAKNWKRTEEATRSLAAKVVLMDDERTRIAFTRRQMETSAQKLLSDMRRCEEEVIPLRILLADHLEEQDRNILMDVITEFERLASKLRGLLGAGEENA
ncbi:ParB/RepB/Spo0J family partition protein [Alicyclobacillus tolerans]|uniref:ParB/Spo0J HTH domain-containing protein n=1 Tax=Alicyclobacillus tolerans TaxID=90970 RepID=A0A1M6UEH8_9BACL|nr:ParB/RepB/Spo0J family partition protein [Alicyclobacillus montanus]SHK67577.1 hypothetical protein SAMN05443507_11959 [Alicyclobacillus montanus]